MSLNDTFEEQDFEGFDDPQDRSYNSCSSPLSSASAASTRHQILCDYCSFVTDDEVELGIHLRKHIG